MMTGAERAAWSGDLARWGDITFALALLAADDRPAAERLATTTLVRALPGDPGALERRIGRTLLLAAGARRQHLRQRLLFSRHALPAALRRIAPADRVLLGLWLLARSDVVALGAPEGNQTTLARRMGAALRRLVPDMFAGLEDASNFDAWLGAQLSPDGDSPTWSAPAAPTDRDQHWQRAVASGRVQLRQMLGPVRLPAPCVQAIGAALAEVEQAPAWWQRRAILGWGSVAIVCALLLLLVAPASRSRPTAAPLQRTPREIVAAALAAWAAPPAQGSLHRQVWARSPWSAAGEPLVTDIWVEAGSPKHRVEVRRGEQLVEWQIGDGVAQLLHAAMPDSSSCRWEESAVLDTAARSFRADASAQQAVLRARLGLGAYSVGADLLQQAAAAADLRSFGTRVVDGSRLVGLGFGDTTSAVPRRLVLWIDAASGQLRLAQELAGAGDQRQSRDLWRLQALDTAAVPLSPPRWSRGTILAAVLLDPSCPGLDPAHFVSLRALDPAALTWGQLFLPQPVPPSLTAAALLRRSPADTYGWASGDFPAIFVGPQRRLRLQTVWVSSSHQPEGEQIGDWVVSFQSAAGEVAGEACRPEPVSHTCFSVVHFDARGFSRDELRALLPTLKPLTPQSWLRYDSLFLEPTPLASDVRDVLAQAIMAQQPAPGQALRTVLQWRARTAPPGSPPRNPYEPDPAVITPEQLRQSLLVEYGAEGVARFRELLTLPDGRLYQAHASDGLTDASYSLQEGVAQSAQSAVLPGAPPPATPLALLLRPFLSAAEPIVVSRQAGAIMLMQWGPAGVDPSLVPIAGPMQPWLAELPAGRLQRRLWLEATTWRLLRAETVQIDEMGGETLLSAVEVTSAGVGAPPAATEFALLPLDPETIVVRRSPWGTFIGSEAANVDAVAHALVWQPDSGLARVFDTRPTRLGTDPTVSTDPRLEQAVFAPLPDIAQLGLTKSTIYELPGGGALQVQQGPRGLLRRGLRAAYLQRRARSIEPVAAVPLQIAGVPHAGWLIEVDGTPTLVVEVDDVLVFVAGLPAEKLRAGLPPLLAQLVWAGVD